MIAVTPFQKRNALKTMTRVQFYRVSKHTSIPQENLFTVILYNIKAFMFLTDSYLKERVIEHNKQVCLQL